MERFSLVLPGHAATVQPPGAEPAQAVVVARQPPTEVNATVAGARLEFVKPQTLPIDSQVHVEIVLDERRDVPVVLSTAIQRDAAGAYVMIAGDDGIARRRDVRPGVVSGPVTQILSGVTAGEKAITVGLDRITDGARVSTR
jgi:multidrug efflux system membrane fusion protein